LNGRFTLALTDKSYRSKGLERGKGRRKARSSASDQIADIGVSATGQFSPGRDTTRL
jgi:hypothetical protein